MAELYPILGGSFDPFHHDHIATAKIALNRFGKVYVFPCGPRADKITVKRIKPVHRAAMLQVSLGQLTGVEFDFSDLEKDHFTTTWELEQRIRSRGFKPVHIIGSDLLYANKKGDGGMRSWPDGEGLLLWNNAKFFIIPRDGHPINYNDLPAKAEIANGGSVLTGGSSTKVRDLIYLCQNEKERHETIRRLVPKEVADYIETHHLYTGMMEENVVPYSNPNPKLFVVTDPYKRELQTLLKSTPFEIVDNPADCDIIDVLGGDGTQIRAVRKYWHHRKPFFGTNFGTVGFLMNDVKDQLNNPKLFMNLELAHCPMLHVDVEHLDGFVEETLAFNDAWVEAAQYDAAEFDIIVNNKKQVSFMGHSGILCTAAGSTGYYFNVRREAFSISENSLGLAISEGTPNYWPGTKLAEDSVVEFVNTNPNRREMYACADGKSGKLFGPVKRMKVYKSRVASARVLKIENDFARKLALKQFPRQ